jgi:hypothetical protein
MGTCIIGGMSLYARLLKLCWPLIMKKIPMWATLIRISVTHSHMYQLTDGIILWATGRGRHLKRYCVISITLHCVSSLLQNAFTLLKSIIAYIIYRSEHIGAVIASYCYWYKLQYKRYCSYSLSLVRCYLSAFRPIQFLRYKKQIFNFVCQVL